MTCSPDDTEVFPMSWSELVLVVGLNLGTTATTLPIRQQDPGNQVSLGHLGPG